MVQLLLDWGAYVNARSGHQGTALQVAARHGTTDALRMLLDKGADANAPPGHMALPLKQPCILRMRILFACYVMRGQTVEIL